MLVLDAGWQTLQTSSSARRLIALRVLLIVPPSVGRGRLRGLDDAGDERTCDCPSRERPHSHAAFVSAPALAARRRAGGHRTRRVSGREATLVVWSPDYDGRAKAWVRPDDGTDAIVGGSRVER
jgi:hypothetical protein